MKVQLAQLVDLGLLVVNDSDDFTVSYLPKDGVKLFVVHPDTVTRNTHHVTYVDYILEEDSWVLQIDDNPSAPISACGDEELTFEIYEITTKYC